MRDNELTQRGLTIEDIAVIEVSEQISPIDFMNSIKDQKVVLSQNQKSGL